MFLMYFGPFMKQGCILVTGMYIVTLCTTSEQRLWESTDLRLYHIHSQRYLNQNSRRCYNVNLFAGRVFFVKFVCPRFLKKGSTFGLNIRVFLKRVPIFSIQISIDY